MFLINKMKHRNTWNYLKQTWIKISPLHSWEEERGQWWKEQYIDKTVIKQGKPIYKYLVRNWYLFLISNKTYIPSSFIEKQNIFSINKREHDHHFNFDLKQCQLQSWGDGQILFHLEANYLQNSSKWVRKLFEDPDLSRT